MSKLARTVGLVACLSLGATTLAGCGPLVVSYTPRAGATDYAKRGEYVVGTRRVRAKGKHRSFDVTLWFPAAQQTAKPARQKLSGIAPRTQGAALARVAPLARPTPYPIVVFSHGMNAAPGVYVNFAEHLASHGFVVMAPHHADNVNRVLFAGGRNASEKEYAQRPVDLSGTIDFAELLQAEGEFSGLLDLERVAVAGHSLGGWTALGAVGGRIDYTSYAAFCEPVRKGDPQRLVCNLEADALARARGLAQPPTGPFPSVTDPRIKAAVALAPALGPLHDTSEISVPSLFITGSGDQTARLDRDVRKQFEGVAGDKTLVTLDGADHFIYFDPCTPTHIKLGYEDACSDPVWDMRQAHEVLEHYATSFLLYRLCGDTEARAAFSEQRFANVSVE